MSKQSYALGLLAAMGAFLALALWVGPVPTQDAFISYEYALHVAAGDGFVFNAGEEATEGHSSLLWILICAALTVAGLDVPTIAPYISLFFGALCVLLLWDLLRRRVTEVEYWLTSLLVFATSAPFVIASMIGSDASLFSALLLACVWLLDRLIEQPTVMKANLIGLVVPLTLLCRFEAVIVAAMVAVVLLRSISNKPSLRRYGYVIAGVIVLAVVVYHGWRVATFGRFIPDSFLLRIGLNTGVFTSVRYLDIVPFGMYYLIVGIISATAFRLSKHSSGELFGFAVALILGVLYMFIKDPTPARPNHAVLLALVIVPWPYLHQTLMRKGNDATSTSHRIGHVLLIAALLLVGGKQLADNRITVVRMQESQRKSLKPMGEWLAAWRPNLTLATDDPGAIDYYANSRTLDLRKHSHLGSTDSNRTRALLALNSDVILLRARGQATVEVDRITDQLFTQVLHQRYRLLTVLRTSWNHDRSVVVYKRWNLPDLTKEQRDSFPKGIGTLSLYNWSE